MLNTLKRRRRGVETEAALARLREMARDRAEQIGPYADQARENAAQRLHQARGWTAPRLETAAHRVEDTVAPRVADMLSSAALRVEPSRARRGLMAARQNGRRIPRAAVLVGVATLGAIAVYGVIKLRKASQDAEWQANLDQAREQVRQTRDRIADKAKDAKERIAGDGAAGTDEAAGEAAGTKEASADLNGRVSR